MIHKRRLLMGVLITISLLVGYSVLTPTGSLRLKIMYYSNPIYALSNKLENITDEYNQKFESLPSNYMMYKLSDPPPQTPSVWIVEKKGIFYNTPHYLTSSEISN